MSLAGSTAAGISSRGPLNEDSREWLRCLADAGSDAEREQVLPRLHQPRDRQVTSGPREPARPGGARPPVRRPGFSCRPRRSGLLGPYEHQEAKESAAVGHDP